MDGTPGGRMVGWLMLGCFSPDSGDSTNTKETEDSAQTSDSGTADSGTTDTATTPAEPLLFLNELMADNRSSWSPDGQVFPDWLELYTPNPDPVDLLGWRLVDDTEKDEVPAFSQSLLVPAGGFLLLIADGLPEAGPEHLPFKLDDGGENLLLYTPEGRRAQWISFEDQLPDIAVARRQDGDEEAGWSYVAGGTPGSSNMP